MPPQNHHTKLGLNMRLKEETWWALARPEPHA